MRTGFSTGLAVVFTAFSLFAQNAVLESCQSTDGWKKSGNVEVEECKSPAAGHHALKITFPGATRATLLKEVADNRDPSRRSFNDYQGISFYIKGDGSDVWNCIAVDSTIASYVYYFPLQSTEWVKYTVPWSAFVPETQLEPIGSFGAIPPCGIKNIRFGSRWTIRVGNEPIPKNSFSVSDIRWEKDVPPLSPAPELAPYSGFLDKLKSGKAVKIQCMGDSLTAGTGLADKDRQRYAAVLDSYLKDSLKNDRIRVWSESVGGAKTDDLRAWVNRDFLAGAPDLVTVWIGYNDKSWGYSRESFRRSLERYLDDVARVTDGKSAVLLFTTPSGSGFRWELQDDFAEEVRALAESRSLPCLDLNAIQKEMGYDEYCKLLNDTVHPNETGHRFIAKTIADFLLDPIGKKLVMPQALKATDVPKIKAEKWDFEADQNFRMNGAVITEERAASGHKALELSMDDTYGTHARWYSPVFNVSEGQQIKVGYDVMNALEKAGGKDFQVFFISYFGADGSGDTTQSRVSVDRGKADEWTDVSGDVVVPPGAKSAQILVWLSNSARGDVFVDNITVE